MSDRRTIPEEQRRCVHHEGVNIRLKAGESRIKRVERGLFWIYTLLVANLCTVITLLILQLTKRPEVVNSITFAKEFFINFI